MEKAGFARSLFEGMGGIGFAPSSPGIPWKAQYPTLKYFQSWDMKISETCLVLTGRI